MKQFFKTMFASTLGVMLAFGIMFMIGVFMTIGMISALSSTPSFTPKSNTVFKIKLNGTLADNPTDNPLAAFLGEESDIISLKDILSAIQIAKQDDRIAGIYIESGMLSAGSASLEAIRRSLLDFKGSGKFIVAYADNYTQGNYFLCSVADHLFLNPQGMLELTGLTAYTMFYKGLMDKIGIEMQIFKVGTYKGAVEPFMLNKLSDANREQIQSYVNSIWNRLTSGIADSRGLTINDINQFADEGLFFSDPKQTVERGFIDELKYRPEAESFVKELAKQTDKKLQTASIAQIKTLETKRYNSAPQIAILYAEGEIKQQSNSPSGLYDMENCITEKIADELTALKDNDEVKAVVFRVNSPGGSSYISEQIWRQVVELKKVKPIVVSMGDMAASGGYYISCAANKIIAESCTLTGSIGIFGMFPNTAGLFNKLDLSTDLVKTNHFSDIGDSARPMNDSEKNLIQNYVNNGYQLFLSRCAEGRNMSTEAVNLIGQGRVWTGEQAKEKGLVDELGGIDLAIQSAAELAKIDDYQITTISCSKNLLDEFIEKQLGSAKQLIARSIIGPEYEHLKALHNLRTNQGLQTRIPYDMKPL